MSAVVTTNVLARTSGAPGIAPRVARRLAWGLWAFAALLALATIAIVVGSLSQALPTTPGYVRGAGAFLVLGYATIGARIASRHPRNAVGWLIIATGIAFGLQSAANEYLFATSSTPDAAPISEGSLRASWVFGLIPSLTGSLFLLLFPDGRVVSRLSRLWLAFAAFAVITHGLAAVLALVMPLPALSQSGDDALRDAVARSFEVQLLGLANIASTVALALCGAALLFRLWIARGDERQQLKWVAAAGGFAVFVNLVFTFAPNVDLFGYVNLLAIMSFPVAAGIAMQRYRLYDIDTILNRTLVYVVVTAFLAGLTAALLGLTQRLFIAVTGQSSEAAIVVTTLVLVAVFTPLRDFVQRAIDSRLKAPAPGLKGLRAFTAEVRAFAHLTDRERLVVRLLAESIAALDASGGAAEIRGANEEWSVRTIGRWSGEPYVTATINEASGAVARIRLGQRRDGEPYAERRLRELRDAVGAVAEALKAAT